MKLWIEITYNSEDFERKPEDQIDSYDMLNREEEDVQKIVKKDLFPLLDWMSNLRSLALIKLGQFTTLPEDYHLVRPLLLEDLLQHVFSKEERPKSLQRLWVNEFVLHRFCFHLLPPAPAGPDESHPAPLKSFFLPDSMLFFVNDQHFDPESRAEYERDHVHHITRDGLFDDAEHLDEITSFPDVVTDSNDLVTIGPPAFLPRLKYVRVTSSDDGDGQVIVKCII